MNGKDQESAQILNSIKSFEPSSNMLSKFDLDSFNDPNQVAAYCEAFGVGRVVSSLDKDNVVRSPKEIDVAVSASHSAPFLPKYSDLCRLHWICLTRKAVNVLEFGSGFSTAIMANAMQILSEHFGDWVASNVRVDRPFHVFSVEEEQRYLEITQRRLGAELSQFVTIQRSSTELITHDSRFATVFSKLPNIAPDFIYLDGPSQYATTQEMNGFSFATRCRRPMSADILRIEFFLDPGTLILVDGRTANARFLRCYLKRNWAYLHDKQGDVHYFELQEDALGKIDSKRLDFSLDGKWLLKN